MSKKYGKDACPYCGASPCNQRKTTGVIDVGDGFEVHRDCHIVQIQPGWWECDRCGTSIYWDAVDEPPSCNYCPNCGAKVVDERASKPSGPSHGSWSGSSLAPSPVISSARGVQISALKKDSDSGVPLTDSTTGFERTTETDMVTDDDRREVAARLRHSWANVPDKNPVRHQLRVLFEIHSAVGLADDDDADAIDLFDRLADLIEPARGSGGRAILCAHCESMPWCGREL